MFQKSLIAGFLTLCLLVVAAFAVPQAVFGIQDSLLYGESVLRPQEDMDAAALNTNYESSLYRRMLKFAEALEKGKSFYVDEKELTLTKEIVDILNSGGLANELIYFLIDSGLVTDQVFEVFAAEDAYVRQSKQFVVYNDDYAQGVNFILWFLELEIEQGRRLSLLMDAQDYTIYAVRTAGNELVYQGNRGYSNFLQLWKPDLMWFTCCGYYQIFDRDTAGGYWAALDYFHSVYDQNVDRVTMLFNSAEAEAFFADRYLQIMYSLERLPTPLQDTNGADVDILWREGNLYDYEDEEWVTASDNAFEMRLPYQDATIRYDVRMFGGVQQEKRSFLFPDMQCGIYELCQLIPEFHWED